MNSNKLLSKIILIVILVVVNILVFAFVKNFTLSISTNIVGLNLSIIILWFVLNIKGKENIYLKYSKLPIAVMYSTITFVTSILLILTGFQNAKVSIITQIILLAIFVIAMCTYKISNNATEASINEDKTKQKSIDDMAKKVELILKNVQDKDMYKKIEEVYDTIRFCKVNVEADTTEIDENIKQKINEMEINIQHSASVETQIKEINELISRRNQL